jgi:hypothetical protein
MTRRVGRFYVSRELCETGDVRPIMAACVIVRCELLFAHDVFEYYALSPHFDVKQLGEMVPTYEWVVTTQGPLGSLSFHAERVPDDDPYRHALRYLPLYEEIERYISGKPATEPPSS